MTMINVVKIGGNVINDPAALSQFLDAFVRIEGPKVLVHGGGREATVISKALGIETVMIEGRRVTDARTLDVVTMVYAGLINKRIVAALQARGCNAIGLSGADGALIRSQRRPAEPFDFGFVGDLTADSVDAVLLRSMSAQGLTPVVCAITYGGDGQLLNTNADSVATAVAQALAHNGGATLTFCFEMPGVMADIKRADSVISDITPADFVALKEAGVVAGGMIPKLQGALNAVAGGVAAVKITHHTLLDNPSAGTTIHL